MKLCRTAGMGKYLSDTFPILDGLKQGDTEWQLP
jgi:hypothetical protein